MKRLLLIFLSVWALMPAVARQKKSAAKRVQRIELSPTQQHRLDYFMHEASRQMVLRNANAAYALYGYCLGIDPTCPEALYQISVLERVLGRDSLAMVHLEQAVRIDDTNVWYKEMLVSRYMDANKYEKAIPVLEDVARLRPKDVQVLQLIEDYYSRTGQYKKALEALGRIELQEGRGLELSVEKADLLDKMGQKDAGINELKALERDFPFDLRIPIVMAKGYFERGDTAQALACYERVRAVDPTNMLLQVGMLNYYENCGRDADAAHLRDSLFYAKETSEELREELTRKMLYDLRDDSARNEKVLCALDSVVKVAPTAMNHALRVSFLEFMEAGSDTLETAWRELLTLDPTNTKVMSSLLSLYLFKDADHPNLEGAEEVCRLGLNSYPENLIFYRYLASILYQQKRATDAAEILESGLRQVTEATNPAEVSDLYALLGDYYHDLDREADAFAAYDSCLVYNADHISCLNNYAYYLSLKNEQLERAERMSYRTVKAEPLNKTYLDTYAWILYMQGNYSMAKFYIDRTISPSADDATVLGMEGVSKDVLEHAAAIYEANELGEQAERYRQLANQKEE